MGCLESGPNGFRKGFSYDTTQLASVKGLIYFQCTCLSISRNQVSWGGVLGQYYPPGFKFDIKMEEIKRRKRKRNTGVKSFVTARKRSLRQGNVFTPVCQLFCPQGSVCLWVQAGCLDPLHIPSGRGGH